jgi:hypothetical protein
MIAQNEEDDDNEATKRPPRPRVARVLRALGITQDSND